MRRGLSVLLVLGVSAVPLAWVPPASAAETWLPEVTASGDVLEMRGVQLAVDPSGNATAVWSAQIGGDPDIQQTATRPVGAADFGPVQTLAPSADLVGLVGHPDGAATVVVVAREGVDDEILASTRAGGTGDFPDVTPIPGSAGLVGDAVVAVDGQGAVTVVWEVNEATGTVMAASTRDPVTGNWSPPEPVAPEDPDKLLVVADLGGTVTVAWTRENSGGDGQAVVVASRAPGADFSVVVVDDGEGYISDLQLATNADSVGALAWHKVGLPGDAVHVTVRPAGEATFGDAAPVPGSNGYKSYLALEVDSEGQVMTAWVDVASEGILVVTRAADGSFAPPVSAWGIEAGFPASRLVSELDRHDALTLVWTRSSPEGGFVASRRQAGGAFAAVDIAAQGESSTQHLDVAADARGDVTVVYDVDAGSSDYAAARILDASGPSLSVAGSASGATASLSAQASDAWSSPTSIAWDFGDGMSGSGPSTSHTYAVTGSYTVRATASDAVGNTTTATTTVRVTVPTVPAVDRHAPTLSGAKVKPKVLPVKKAAKLLVISSEHASLKAVVERRRTNGKWRPVAKKSWAVETGANKEKLYGKRAQKRLVPGRYRIHLTATDAAGNVSAAMRVRFRVVA